MLGSCTTPAPPGSISATGGTAPGACPKSVTSCDCGTGCACAGAARTVVGQVGALASDAVSRAAGTTGGTKMLGSSVVGCSLPASAAAPGIARSAVEVAEGV